MAQKRFFNFLDDDKTWDIAGMNMAVNSMGRLNGFDTILGDNITDFSITHEGTGYKRITNVQQEQLLGAWSSKQGVIITESEALNGLIIKKNLTDFTRIDLLVGSHEYISNEGGMEAYYGIIEGQPAENPVPPEVADSGRDVILGYFIVNSGAIDFTNIDFCPANTSYLKNDTQDTRYNTPGIFTHHLRLDTTSVGMGSVSALKTTLTLNPLEIKDKSIYGYPKYYPNYYWLDNIPGGTFVTTFAKIEAPDIIENQIINLINPFNKLAIAQSTANTLDNIFSPYPTIHYFYPGDVITLLRKNGVWNLLNSEVVSRARKMRDTLSFSYAEYSLIDEKLIPKSTKKGNVIKVEVLDNEPKILSYLPSNDIHATGDSSGNVLFVEFSTSFSFNLTIRHAGQDVPTGYKPIQFAGNPQDFVTNRGGMMLGFVETADAFKPINWDLNPLAPSQNYVNLFETNETKFTYINTGVRVENSLVRMKGQIEIIADEAAAPDIGRVFKLYPGTIPETERRIPTYIYHKFHDFGVTPDTNAHKPLPVIVTIQGQNTPQPGLFISGGGYIPYNYVLYLDGLQYDIK